MHPCDDRRAAGRTDPGGREDAGIARALACQPVDVRRAGNGIAVGAEARPHVFGRDPEDVGPVLKHRRRGLGRGGLGGGLRRLAAGEDRQAGHEQQQRDQVPVGHSVF